MTYEAAVDAALSDRDARVVLDIIASGVRVAEVRLSEFGLLWISVIEVSTASGSVHPFHIDAVGQVVRDRRRWDRVSYNNPRVLVPVVELLDHPDRPNDMRLAASPRTNPTTVHVADADQVLTAARLAIANRTRRKLTIA